PAARSQQPRRAPIRYCPEKTAPCKAAYFSDTSSLFLAENGRLAVLAAQASLQQIGQHPARVEIFLHDGARRAAMARLILVEPAKRSNRFLRRAKGKQPFARGQEIAESCVLHDDGTAHRHVPCAAVAEPPATRADVGVLGHAEFRAREPQIILICPGGARHFA